MHLAYEFQMISTPNKNVDLIIIQQGVWAMRHNAQCVITESYIFRYFECNQHFNGKQ